MKKRETTQLQAKFMEKDRRQDTINPQRCTCYGNFQIKRDTEGMLGESKKKCYALMKPRNLYIQVQFEIRR